MAIMNNVELDFAADAIYIRDDEGEIVSWVMQEWIDDPKVVLSIVNAVRIALQDGPEALRATIGMEYITPPSQSGCEARYLMSE